MGQSVEGSSSTIVDGDGLASSVGEERPTSEVILESFLLQQSNIQRTIRGRIANQKIKKPN
ncbi:MAG: hypothetical protein CMF43_04625 [Legionellales bacterium]|nr:hypothetical protein [Legionellales bacterium]